MEILSTRSILFVILVSGAINTAPSILPGISCTSSILQRLHCDYLLRPSVPNSALLSQVLHGEVKNAQCLHIIDECSMIMERLKSGEPQNISLLWDHSVIRCNEMPYTVVTRWIGYILQRSLPHFHWASIHDMQAIHYDFWSCQKVSTCTKVQTFNWESNNCWLCNKRYNGDFRYISETKMSWHTLYINLSFLMCKVHFNGVACASKIPCTLISLDRLYTINRGWFRHTIGWDICMPLR